MERSPVVFMFSGQGSQYYQMGRELYDGNSVFKENLDWFDRTIASRYKLPLLETIFDSAKKRSDTFEEPVLSSLAIFAVEHALAVTLQESGVIADKIIGSSMGMFVAATFADCITKEEGLDAIYSLMKNVKQCDNGTMIAVIANPSVYYNSAFLKQRCSLAAINFHSSFAIALPHNVMQDVESYLDRQEVIFQRLPVSRAYHSRWMDGAHRNFMDETRHIAFRKATIPLICCSRTARLGSTDINDLWYAVREPLLFGETVNKLDRDGSHRYIDVGPSGTMATYLKYILPPERRADIYGILAPSLPGVDRFNHVVSSMSTQ